VKYLKSYKLFESKSSDVDIYLQKMGATKDDINDIFISLIDQKYEVDLYVKYEDKIGRVRGKKTTNYETPILFIDLLNKSTRYVGGSTKLDLSYIENLYYSLSRLNSMYSDKLEKITYELHTNAEMTIRCYFKPEEDESIISISLEDMADAINSSIRSRFGHVVNTDIRNQSNKELRLDIDVLPYPDDEDKVLNKLQDELKKSDKDWATNYDSVDNLKKNILKVLESDLSKKFDMKLFFSHTIDHSWNREGRIDGIYTYEDDKKVKLFEFSISPESRYYRYNIKKNFFRQKPIEIELYWKIEIILEII